MPDGTLAPAPVTRLREEYGLTELQALFVQHYPACDFNAAEAARQAGYSENSAREIGHENLTKPHIQKALSEYLGELSRRAEIRAEEVLEEYRRIAFSDLRDVLRWGPAGVELRPSDELPPEAAAAVREVELNEWRQEDGTVRRRARVKMHSKEKALEKLGQFLELWQDRSGVKIELIQQFGMLPSDELRKIAQMDDEEILELMEDRYGNHVLPSAG